MTSVQSLREAPPPDHRQTLTGDLREIVGDIRQYRNLLYQLTLRDIRIRYKQAAMGFLWAIFMPVVAIASSPCASATNIGKCRASLSLRK